MALELLIDAVDRISILQAGSLSISQTNDGLNSTCEFDLLDHTVFQKDAWTVEETRVEDGDVITSYVTWGNETKVEVKVCDGATTYFAGILSRIGPMSRMGHEAQIVHCDCHDFNQVLEESVVDELEEYAVKTDEQIIDDIFAKYVTGINFADHVAGGFVFDEIEFENITVRKVLDILADQSQYEWYVDYDKKLHYKIAGEAAPAWHLSDNPDQVNSFSYFDDITKEIDATNLVDSVFIIGESVALWFPAGGAIDHPAIIRDTSIVDIDDMEDRADAVLAKYGEPIATYTLKTYKAGLRAGMYVRLVCAFYDVDDTFLINSLTITFPKDKDPVYEVVCGGLDSSASASAHRLSLDAIQDWQGYTSPTEHLSSLGWAHDLGFSSTDVNTVAWTLGQIIAANGTIFNIVAGNTGNMGAGVHYVYLDTAISATVLQTTQVIASTVGYNRIPIAVCWPGDGVGAEKAGFMVFQGGDEMPLILCATNIGADSIRTIHLVADCVTATEVNIGTLSAITADMGTLTAGTIQTAAAGNNRIVINMADGIRGINAANEVQFQLTPVTGKAYFGGNAGILDKDGLRFLGAGATGDPRRIRFMYNDAGTERRMGRVFSDWGGGAAEMTTWLQAWRMAGAPWPANVHVTLIARDDIAATDVRLSVSSSGRIDSPGCTDFQVTQDLRVGQGLIVGSLAVNPASGYCRIGKGLHVGSTATDAADDEIICDGDTRVGGGIQIGETDINPETGCALFQGRATHPANPADGLYLYHYTGGGKNALYVKWGDGTTAEIVNHP